MDADTSLPHPAALHPALPGPDRFRLQDETDLNTSNDYTVTATDMSRYQASVGQSNSVPRYQHPSDHAALPAAWVAKVVGGPAAENEPSGTEQTVDGLDPGSESSSAAAVKPSFENEISAQEAPAAAALITAETSIAGGAEDMGPLTGFHPIERTASYFTPAGDEEEGEAGPMHFAGPMKGRGGSKSLKEISSLFSGDAAADAVNPPDSGDS
jgi:hypothetical protein